MRKYEFTEETKVVADGVVLHRIRAVRDFGYVKAGELGGWIEKEKNLSHDGLCWVRGNAKVYGDARVCDNADIYGNAEVFGEAKVFGEAIVCGDAKVYDNAAVCDNAKVFGDAEAYGSADVRGHAEICGGTEIISETDYSVFKNTWSSHRWFTYTRSNRMWKVGCFHGTGEELIAKAYEDSKLSGKCYEIIVHAQEAIESALGEKSKGEAE